MAFTIRVNEEIDELLTKKAQDIGITKSALIKVIVSEYLEKLEDEQKKGA